MLVVRTPLGKILLAMDGIKGCGVKIGEYINKVDLVVLDMEDFDVILGMD